MPVTYIIGSLALIVKPGPDAPEKIPYFIAQARDFYDLGMTVNPEATKQLYQNIESDSAISTEQRTETLPPNHPTT